MDDNFVITIRVCGVAYKLSIPRKDEEIYRNAAALLNERIDHYRDKFNVQHTDILSMVAFEFAVEYHKLLNQYQNTPASVMNQLAQMLATQMDDDNDEDGIAGE